MHVAIHVVNKTFVSEEYVRRSWHHQDNWWQDGESVIEVSCELRDCLYGVEKI